jgi:hypothetical protein
MNHVAQALHVSPQQIAEAATRMDAANAIANASYQASPTQVIADPAPAPAPMPAPQADAPRYTPAPQDYSGLTGATYSSSPYQSSTPVPLSEGRPPQPQQQIASASPYSTYVEQGGAMIIPAAISGQRSPQRAGSPPPSADVPVADTGHHDDPLNFSRAGGSRQQTAAQRRDDLKRAAENAPWQKGEEEEEDEENRNA